MMLSRAQAWLMITAADRTTGTQRAVSGVQLLLLSFAGLITVGTIGLLVLPGLYTGPRLGVVDALFTITSAVCVTGLIVVDTATYFTVWGKVWIALFIQLGGLGIITFATLVATVIGRRTSLAMEQASGVPDSMMLDLDARGIVRAVVLFTLSIEAAGAAILWLAWLGRYGLVGGLGHAVFHAVSAFCNAGFSTFSDNLVGFQREPLVLGVIGALIVVGGLGFLVMIELRSRYVRRLARHLSTHSRLVLVTTAVLVIGATALYAMFEWQHALRELPWPHRLTNAAFMSVTPRTAGFNTVNYDQVSNPGVFLTIVLMFVGGSPGGTAGGVKTTAAALLVLLLVSRLRGFRAVSVFHRSVPDETVSQATGLVMGSVALLGIVVFLLLAIELPAELVDRAQYTRLVFEATSAFGTVGLSMGATPGLTAFGKMLIIMLMYLGRVGPLSLVAAMAVAGRRSKYRYAHDNVGIG